MKHSFEDAELQSIEEQLYWIADSEALLFSADNLSMLVSETLKRMSPVTLHDEELENAAGGLNKPMEKRNKKQN